MWQTRLILIIEGMAVALLVLAALSISQSLGMVIAAAALWSMAKGLRESADSSDDEDQ